MWKRKGELQGVGKLKWEGELGVGMSVKTADVWKSHEEICYSLSWSRYFKQTKVGAELPPKCIKLLPEAIGYETNIPLPGVGYQHLSCWSRRPPIQPVTGQQGATAVGSQWNGVMVYCMARSSDTEKSNWNRNRSFISAGYLHSARRCCAGIGEQMGAVQVLRGADCHQQDHAAVDSVYSNTNQSGKTWLPVPFSDRIWCSIPKRKFTSDAVNLVKAHGWEGFEPYKGSHYYCRFGKWTWCTCEPVTQITLFLPVDEWYQLWSKAFSSCSYQQ